MAKEKNYLYRGEYIIGVYEIIDETLIVLLDNAEQLSNYLEIPRRSVDVMLCNIFNKKQSHIKYKQKLYEIAFIRVV